MEQIIVWWSRSCDTFYWQPFRFPSKNSIHSTPKNLRILKNWLKYWMILWFMNINFYQWNKLNQNLKFFLIFSPFLSPKSSAVSTWSLNPRFLDASSILALTFIFVNLLKSLVSINILVSGIFLSTLSIF